MRLQSRRSARAGPPASTAKHAVRTAAAVISALRLVRGIGRTIGDSPPNIIASRQKSVASLSLMNQRAGAVIGEQFQQHGMRHLAVENDDPFDTLVQRLDTGLYLWDHAARNGPIGDQPPGIVDRKLGNQRLGTVEHA